MLFSSASNSLLILCRPHFNPLTLKLLSLFVVMQGKVNWEFSCPVSQPLTDPFCKNEHASLYLNIGAHASDRNLFEHMLYDPELSMPGKGFHPAFMNYGPKALSFRYLNRFLDSPYFTPLQEKKGISHAFSFIFCK